MEKKTMGAFIAALRKANGMTQRDLAERLNVSDKTVSRWERDEGAPDLSVIPVIAEIFDVTCDELLRGQRKPPAERVEPLQEETAPKCDKQRQRLVKSTLAQYRNQTLLAIGISSLGLIAALICNFAFLRAILGFLIGLVFYAAGVVCHAVFLNKALSGVEDADIEEKTLVDLKKKVIALTEKAFALTVTYIGLTLPLTMVEDAYWGLEFESFLPLGLLFAFLLLIVYASAVYLINSALLRKGVYALSDKEKGNRDLKKKYACILAAVIVVTLFGQIIGNNSVWNLDSLLSHRGIEFHDYESFKEYMNRNDPYTDPYGVTEIHVGIEYHDAEGNEISEEEALTETLVDINGNVVCTYLHRNSNVFSIEYTSEREGTVLPIRVWTMQDYHAADNAMSKINLMYALLYPAEILIAVMIYKRKKAN